VLELKCDGIAVLTLLALGVDPAHVSGAMRKLTAFNERLGATANSDEYPSIGERMRFIKALLENRRS
jgi:hypothetical protein